MLFETSIVIRWFLKKKKVNKGQLFKAHLGSFHRYGGMVMDYIRWAIYGMAFGFLVVNVYKLFLVII